MRLLTGKAYPKHCRCSSKTACGRRFKGYPGETPCPYCWAKSRLDKWAQRKPWRARLCYCDGYDWSIKGSPHREGGGACKFNPENWVEE